MSLKVFCMFTLSWFTYMRQTIWMQGACLIEISVKKEEQNIRVILNRAQFTILDSFISLDCFGKKNQIQCCCPFRSFTHCHCCLFVITHCHCCMFVISHCHCCLFVITVLLLLYICIYTSHCCMFVITHCHFCMFVITVLTVRQVNMV